MGIHLPNCLVSGLLLLALGRDTSAQPRILNPNDYAHYVAEFNTTDIKPVENLIPNAAAWEWMTANVPLFDCPDKQFEQTYYFRWWTYRKHICQSPHGRLITEFLTPVGHAGPYNTISCAFGHHLAEGRWLRDQVPLDEYTLFWYRSGPGGSPYSSRARAEAKIISVPRLQSQIPSSEPATASAKRSREACSDACAASKKCSGPKCRIRSAACSPTRCANAPSSQWHSSNRSS